MTNREIAAELVNAWATSHEAEYVLIRRVEAALDAKDRKPIDGEGWAEAAFDVKPIVPGSIRYLNDGLEARMTGAQQYKGPSLGYQAFSGFK